MHILCPHCHNPIEIVKLTPREELACPACGSTFHLEGGATTGSESSAGWKVGKFDVIETVGQGAFGTVYKARDPELDRVVAIKVPRTGNLAGPQELDRFLREARSVAQLRHPSIVSIHEVGESGDVPYIVSDFVRGVTLADLLSARRPGFRETAELIATVADALQYAHEQGVVHRDVKPSNIMIGEDGRPGVMDFGLAKREAGEITMTIEGQVLGTPAYMSPEQARGEGHAVDGRSDVYSLGVVLYQLLTGELPFRGTQRMLLHQVLHDEPRSLRSLNDHIPRDLETVTLKAMAKEPGRRYGTAGELADDLRRWLKGEPIRARPVGRVERAARWASRRPAAALLAVSGVAALALVGLAVGAVYNGQLEIAYQSEAAARQREADQRKTAEEARAIAEAAKSAEEVERGKAEIALQEAVAANQTAKQALAERDQTAYLHSIFLADLALRENDVLQAQQRLDECKEKLRGWEWRYLNGRCHTELFSIPERATFSPDGSRMLGSGRDGMLRVFNAWTGQEVLALKRPALSNVSCFSPNGTRIAVTSLSQGNRVVGVYDARTGQEVFAHKRPASTPAVGGLVFSPDGSRIADMHNDGVVVYDARTGQEILTFKKRQDGARAFSPDGSRIAVDSDGGVVRLYDTRTGQEALVLKGMMFGPFSPDGSRIALRLDDVVRLYDARTGQEVVTLKAVLWGIAHFSPDGSRIAVSPDIRQGDGVVRVYDAQMGQETLSLKGPAGLSRPVFSPDGTRIAVASALEKRGGDGLVRVYDARTGQETLALKGPAVFGLPVFSPDGNQIAVMPGWTKGDGLVRVYDARTGQETLTFKGLRNGAFSPDGSRIAVDSDGGVVVRVYDARTGQEALVLKGTMPHTPPFSPDGSRIALSLAGGVRVYDVRTGLEVLALQGLDLAQTVVFSTDGTRIVFASQGLLRLYDARTGQELLALTGPTGNPLFSPDGARIAAQDPGGVQVWTAPKDAAAWQAERRAALADSVSAWHEARAAESERAGEWFATAFHLGRLSDAEPGSGLHHFRRGLALAQVGRGAEANEQFEKSRALKDEFPETTLADVQASLGRWDVAAKYYARAAEVSGAGADVYFRHALLRLHLGDRPGYVAACAAIVQHFGNSQDARDASLVADSCAVGPDALRDLQPAVEAARRAVQANPRDSNVRNTLGAILYRAGQDAEAIKELNEAIRLNPAGGDWPDFLFLAMAHRRLGKPADARTWLEKATQAAAKLRPVFWTARLEWELLHREAEALLKEPPPEPKK